MRFRNLGANGPEVSVLGFGAMTLAPVYGGVEESDAVATLLATLDAGITFVDTADIYGMGSSESLIGRELKARRDDIVLATKFGGNQDKNGILIPGMGRPEYVRQALDASLTRLQTDHVELYYLHRLDPTTPIEETAGALAELVQAGKIGGYGLSEVSARTLRRAHAVHPVTAVQTEYSLFQRSPEDELIPTCDELGVAFVAYSPLGRGILGGAVRTFDDLEESDWRRGNPRFQSENLERNVSLADQVATLAAEQDITTAQLALAWLIHRGALPIPGTRKVSNALANAAAGDLTLDDSVFKRLEDLVPPGAAAGAQGNEAYLANLDRS
ncbi:aldo/keto reductase [Actinomadura rupiterrae]|uniref:aldo/keto reductase n=1 Tax=Actinomadura rupiterrae TaxID=559627 RepID=UPI0020A37D36|nr:aldo/keto reductase [Actinomadura rupiterrae]MCP2335904.1 aryl-alcohol dehydrogenase-like predicted oxidoreductase [Actinomadura rupiterrae]